MDSLGSNFFFFSLKNSVLCHHFVISAGDPFCEKQRFLGLYRAAGSCSWPPTASSVEVCNAWIVTFRTCSVSRWLKIWWCFKQYFVKIVISVEWTFTDTTFNNKVYNINCIKTLDYRKFYLPKERKSEREEFQELNHNKM